MLVQIFIFSAITVAANGQKVVPNANNFRFSLETNLTFALSASNIPNTGVARVDPYIKLYSAIGETEPIKFATSDVVKNTPDPEFNDVFTFLWKRGTNQKWIFKVKDSKTFKDTTLGEVIVDVDQYVNANERMNVSLSNGKGSILIRKTTPVRFRLYARNLPRLDPFGGRSDPFVKIYWRRGSHGEDIKLATTNVIDNVENADWDATFEFPAYIKGTDLWWSFKVRDHDGLASDEDLGEALVEIDPFVEKRQTKIVNLGKTGNAKLGITPAW